MHFLPKKHCFWPKKAPFLPKDLQKVRKSRQILIRDKIAYVRAQNFRPSQNFSAGATRAPAQLLPPWQTFDRLSESLGKMDRIDQIEAEYELQLKINKFVEPSMFAPISHFWRESESVANLQAKTQIFTQKNRSWLRFYSEFLSKNLAGGVSGVKAFHWPNNIKPPRTDSVLPRTNLGTQLHHLGTHRWANWI